MTGSGDIFFHFHAFVFNLGYTEKWAEVWYSGQPDLWVLGHRHRKSPSPHTSVVKVELRTDHDVDPNVDQGNKWTAKPLRLVSFCLSRIEAHIFCPNEGGNVLPATGPQPSNHLQPRTANFTAGEG